MWKEKKCMLLFETLKSFYNYEDFCKSYKESIWLWGRTKDMVELNSVREWKDSEILKLVAVAKCNP